MEVFTLDVGSQTQDFLLLTDENIRNCPKMVLPSPTKILAEKIKKTDSDIYLYGYTMGGGPIKFAVIEHIKRGYRVFADEKSALTFSDNLEKVKKMGIILERPENAKKIKTCDVDLEFYSEVLAKINYCLPPTFAVAVQDHGFSPYESNRVFRFKMFKRMINKRGYLESFLYSAKEIPAELNRMVDAARSILDFCDGDVYVTDTAFAAIAGCSLDAKLPALLLNFGNSHITGAVVDKDWQILSIFEHHTKVLKQRGREYIKKFIDDFVKGKITNEFVLNDGGHGCYIKEVTDVQDVVCTGPNTYLSSFREAKLFDIMIVGNLGMLAMLEKRGVIHFQI